MKPCKPILFLDTNILLDYVGLSCSDFDHNQAVNLIKTIWKYTDGFLLTPTVLKDFHYLVTAVMKRDIRKEKGQISAEDAKLVSGCALALLNTVKELGNVASEGMSECEMAYSLCKQHNDYEDNLLVAVALRSEAHCIVTRDEVFIKHCPIACLTPADAIACLEAGAWQA